MGGLGQGAVYLLFRTLLLLAGIAFAIPGTKGFLVWLFEKVICYRVQVVKANLMLAFPGKTTEEIHRISSDFYRHFVDLILQQRQGRGMGELEWKEAVFFAFGNALEEHSKKGRSCIVVMGHTDIVTGKQIGRAHV